MGHWGSDNTIELIALILAIPGAMAAVATLWILLAGRRCRSRLNPLHALSGHELGSSSDADEELTTRRAANEFQHQYTHLYREITSERDQWAQELGRLPQRG